jgi:hypothetical protein
MCSEGCLLCMPCCQPPWLTSGSYIAAFLADSMGSSGRAVGPGAAFTGTDQTGRTRGVCLLTTGGLIGVRRPANLDPQRNE